MSAYRPKKGSLEIDRIISPLGRVRLRTGTQDKRLAERYEAMLDALPLDTVRLIRDRHLSLRVAYDAWVAGRAASLPSAQTLRPLIATFRSWLAAPLKAVGDAETKARTHVVTLLEDLRPDAQVRDLPLLVQALRQDYATHGPAFNRARASCLAFVRDLLGRRHELYDAVVSIPTLPEPPRFARHPCTVAEARAIARDLGDRWGPVWWALCCHGMGPREYWVNEWSVAGGGLEIAGQKRAARNRVVPLVVTPPPVTGKAAGFAEALERAELGVTPYDARRSYARWLEEAGIPSYRQDAYMGHGPKEMRGLYKWGEIKAWLAEDGEKLRRHVGEQRTRLRVSR